MQTSETRTLVASNALYLIVVQLINAVVSFAAVALLARHLGARDYGVLYLATTFVQSAFIIAEIGQNHFGAVALARGQESTAEMLGSGLFIRLLGGALICLPVMALAHGLDYPAATRDALAWLLAYQFLNSLLGGMTVIFRGLERMDQEARVQLATKLLYAAATVAAVTLGANLVHIIQAQILSAMAAVLVGVHYMKRSSVSRPIMRWPTVRKLARGGLPFMFWNITIALHVAVDVVMLSKLAPEQVVGWYGAASKFISLLIIPANMMGAALFPTLARLFIENHQRYRALTRSILRPIIMLGGVAAAGTFIFADTLMSVVYGAQGFAPAAENLQVLSSYLILLFVDIALGSAIMAANRQTRFAFVKAACVLLLVLLNALLIPITQARYGNGGIGCAAATAGSELFMLAAAIAFLPRGTVPARILYDVLRALCGAAAMFAVARALGSMSPILTMPLAVIAYITVVWLSGGINRQDLLQLGRAIRLRRGELFPDTGDNGDNGNTN